MLFCIWFTESQITMTTKLKETKSFSLIGFKNKKNFKIYQNIPLIALQHCSYLPHTVLTGSRKHGKKHSLKSHCLKSYTVFFLRLCSGWWWIFLFLLSPQVSSLLIYCTPQVFSFYKLANMLIWDSFSACFRSAVLHMNAGRKDTFQLSCLQRETHQGSVPRRDHPGGENLNWERKGNQTNPAIKQISGIRLSWCLGIHRESVPM